MINGITVINEIPAVSECNLTLLWGGIFLSVLIMAIIILMIYGKCAGENYPIIMIIVMVTTFILPIIMFATMKEDIPIRYQVTIDETVSFIEFHEKYEIINHDGNIYTIELKENQNGL